MLSINPWSIEWMIFISHKHTLYCKSIHTCCWIYFFNKFITLLKLVLRVNSLSPSLKKYENKNKFYKQRKFLFELKNFHKFKFSFKRRSKNFLHTWHKHWQQQSWSYREILRFTTSHNHLILKIILLHMLQNFFCWSTRHKKKEKLETWHGKLGNEIFLHKIILKVINL